MRRQDFETFARQEKALILLNLSVLAGLFLIHVWHFSVDGGTLPEESLLVAFALRFLWQVADFLWLETRTRSVDPQRVEVLARMSIVIHLAFAWLVTLFGDEERSHYIVLMALPVAAAGFRFGWGGVALVWATAAVHGFFEVWFFRLTRPPLQMVEFFEAGTIALLYLVVGVATALLAQQLYGREEALERSLGELERTREAMVAAERQAAVGRLSRAVAHEIRNPVGMIASSIGVWREKRGKDLEGASELLEVIDVEAKRLERLTSDFLEFARERRLERRTVDLRDLLVMAVGLARAHAERARVVIDVAECEPLAGYFDPFALQQVLLNLLKNAIEATPAAGRVTVVAGRVPDGIELRVENEGPEIPPPVVTRLFQPFESTKPGGSGLGLAISSSIVQAHRGELALVANEAGRVCFAIKLPDVQNKEDADGAGPDR
ncbi:hypothetical protein GC173_13605 [bacterium]|nr:hypothetical protein [bacterium]